MAGDATRVPVTRQGGQPHHGPGVDSSPPARSSTSRRAVRGGRGSRRARPIADRRGGRPRRRHRGARRRGPAPRRPATSHRDGARAPRPESCRRRGRHVDGHHRGRRRRPRGRDRCPGALLTSGPRSADRGVAGRPDRLQRPAGHGPHCSWARRRWRSARPPPAR